jgi:hypothetical protein
MFSIPKGLFSILRSAKSATDVLYGMCSVVLTLSLTALGPISPVSLKCYMLKKSLSGVNAILHVYLFYFILFNLQ